MAKKTAKPVRVFGDELRFADGSPVTAKMFENEPSETAMDRADALLDTGDLDGAATWRKIIAAIDVMQATERRLGLVQHPFLNASKFFPNKVRTFPIFPF